MKYKKIINNKKKLIAITGATGFIGVELVKFLKEKRYKVLTLYIIKKKNQILFFGSWATIYQRNVKT